jgi:hypothetical protein
MSMSTSTSTQFLKLLNAARGQPTCFDGKDNTNKNDNTVCSSNNNNRPSIKESLKTPKPLPCFPLHADHIRIITSKSISHNHNAPKPPTSNNINSDSDNDNDSDPQLQLSSSPTEFHHHLCTLIKNAKRRVKLATLYIGAGNGCMSITSSMSTSVSTCTSTSQNLCQPTKEQELLQSIQSLSFNNHNHNNNDNDDDNDNDNDKDIEIKIVMDASRALRPIRIVSDTNSTHTHTTYSSNTDTSNKTTTTTTSAQEVYYSLFRRTHKDGEEIMEQGKGKKNKIQKGLALFHVHDKFIASLPSPLNEVLGVFHLKVCFYLKLYAYLNFMLKYSKKKIVFSLLLDIHY